MVFSMLLCIVSVPFCSSVLNTLSVSLFLSQRHTFDVQCLTILLLILVPPLSVVFSILFTRTWCSISVILSNATLLFRRVIYRHIDYRETNIELSKCSSVDRNRHTPQLWTVYEVHALSWAKIEMSMRRVIAHNESWWDCADRITRLRYEGHIPIIVFNYYQNHEGLLYYYHPYFVFKKSVFYLECKFIRWYLHVLWCERPLWTPSASVFIWRNFCVPVSLISRISWCPSSRNRRERTSEYVQDTSDTSFVFWTHLLNRDIITNNIQMDKMSMSIQSIPQKKKITYVRFEEHRSDKHLILFRSTDIAQFACFWGISERIRLRSFLLMQWRYWMNLYS